MSDAPFDFLFMGEQEDVELRNWIARGVRVYDGTDTAEARCEKGHEARIPAGSERWCGKCLNNGEPETRLIEVVP